MFNFQEANSRLGTNSTKWDRYQKRWQLDDVIPLWVADMDFQCPEEVTERIIQRARHGIFGYTDAGSECLEAVVDWEKRHHQVTLRQEDIVFTTGVVYALYTAVEMLTRPDEKVLVQPPVYPPFFNTPLSLNRTVVYNPLLLDGQPRMNLEELVQLLKEDPSIRVMIFCNPHNPIGKSWTKEELTALLEILERYDLTLLSDEIHADLVFPPHQHVSMLAVDERFNQRIIQLGAPTKTFNLAGLKISYALIPNEALRTEFARRAKASGLSSINIFGYEALTAAYQHGDAWLEACLQAIQDNLHWLKDFLDRELPLCRFDLPESTYLAWVDFSAYHVPDNFQEILKFEGGVELQDGRGFKNSNGYHRINVACPQATLKKGMQRVVDTMRKKGWLK